jgi:UDP:flavonoid glycosyltransferase YjiC (YdhE family)
VYVTLGTVVFGATEAFNATLAAVADLDVDVLIAVGPEGDPEAVEQRNARIHVERFVDQARVIPLVDVVVHHGGSGTALAATAAGLPQVVMPQGADQFQNAELLARIGVARAVLPGTTEEVLATYLRDVLTDPQMKQTATRLADEIARMPSPADVAEQLAAMAAAT